MYCVRDNKILKIIDVKKYTEKGTGIWCVLEGMTNAKMISLSSIFLTYNEALDKLQ